MLLSSLSRCAWSCDVEQLYFTLGSWLTHSLLSADVTNDDDIPSVSLLWLLCSRHTVYYNSCKAPTPSNSIHVVKIEMQCYIVVYTFPVGLVNNFWLVSESLESFSSTSCILLLLAVFGWTERLWSLWTFIVFDPCSHWVTHVNMM